MTDQSESKVVKETHTCAHCGAENPRGLLLCLTCGHEPTSGRDLFSLPEIPMPGEPFGKLASESYFHRGITMPDSIQVPDPLPIPTMEDFVAPPPQPNPKPTAVYRASPRLPREMAPLLRPLPQWIIGLMGLGILVLLGLATAGNLAALNLPGGVCLGSIWLVMAALWLPLMLARKGEAYSLTTGVRRRLVTSMGQRLFEITPSAVVEQRAQLPITKVPSFTHAASELIYLNSSGDRSQQITDLLLGTLCALVADGNLELATRTYDVVTASPFKRSVEAFKKTAMTRRAVYIGPGYLEQLILEQLLKSPGLDARELATTILAQAGTDLLDRINASIAELPPAQEGQAPDLDAQLAALRLFCDELKTLNPDLYEQLAKEVKEGVLSLTRPVRQMRR